MCVRAVLELPKFKLFEAVTAAWCSRVFGLIYRKALTLLQREMESDVRGCWTWSGRRRLQAPPPFSGSPSLDLHLTLTPASRGRAGIRPRPPATRGLHAPTPTVPQQHTLKSKVYMRQHRTEHAQNEQRIELYIPHSHVAGPQSNRRAPTQCWSQRPQPRSKGALSGGEGIRHSHRGSMGS